MAIVNRTSAAVTNSDAVPRLKNNPASGGELKEKVGYVAPGTADSATSVARFCRVPSRARISGLVLTHAAFTVGGAVNIGVYKVTENGGAAVSQAFFASALALTAAHTEDSTLINQSGTYTLALQEQPLWQALGLAADPGVEYDIAYTITTDFNGGQPVLMKVRYVG